MKTIERVVQTQAEVDAVFKINSYNKYIVYFSGGKDSIATFLYLLEMGIDKSNIELWHHDIDGREGSNLMDWGCTADYCRKFAEAFDVKIYFSWREGGFEREMLRKNSWTGDILFEMPDAETGETILIKKEGSRQQRHLGTRLKFPQVSGDLSVRWCSAYLKIDVGSSAIRGQERFNHSRTLVLTGERAQESMSEDAFKKLMEGTLPDNERKGRGTYNIFEADRADCRKNGSKGKKDRLVDHLRPLRDIPVQDVWNLIKKYNINPHPAYKLGFGRVSCMNCIFGNANQFASTMKINPIATQKIAHYEEEFGVTIKRKDSVKDLIEKGTAYPNMKDSDIDAGIAKEFTQSIFTKEWSLPSGAFAEGCGAI